MVKADVVVVGAGAVGCAIARELSKYDLKIVVVDKNEDIGGDASKSNSAIIHTGFDAQPGSLESKLVVAANPMYDKLCEDLDIPFDRRGAIVAATTEEEYALLAGIEAKAHENGVYDVEKLDAARVKALEPHVTDEIKGGLLVPRESLIDPFVMVAALAENAAENGVSFLLSAPVLAIETESGAIRRVVTARETIETTYVINAAGLFCDDIADMVGVKDFTVHPRKGQFFILDRTAPYQVERIILPVPTKHTKGKLVSPTLHGNLLIGPTAEDMEDKFDKSVTREGMKEVLDGVRKLVPAVSSRDAVTEYAGLRPTRTPEGYFIGFHDAVKGYLGVTGIRSTGLTSSVAIGVHVVDLLKAEGCPLDRKANFVEKRKGIPKFAHLSKAEQEKLIAENPQFGHVVCRCETVTEGEIVDAIHRNVGAHSLDAIKRRLRPGMGRCQGGFCTPRILEILSRELEKPATEIRKNNQGSEILISRNR